MEVTSTEVQNNFGQYLKFSYFEDIIVTKSGKKAAVISRYSEKTGEKPVAGRIISQGGKEETDGDGYGKNDASKNDASINSAASVVRETAETYDLKKSGITYEAFLKLSESGENRYEYIDGDVYLLASPIYEHQYIITEVLNIMYQWFKGKKCRPLTAPFDITLSGRETGNDKNVVQPDIVVICDMKNINKKGRYTGTPSLVVEVLSEFTRSKDMIKKLDLYAGSGINEYWIIDPDSRQLLLYRFIKGGISECRTFRSNETVVSLHFVGLEFKLDSIF